jgi:hypothetical protein
MEQKDEAQEQYWQEIMSSIKDKKCTPIIGEGACSQ